MLRWFLLFLLVVIVYRLLTRGSASRRPPSVRGPEQMVVCARCGVYVPASEALATDGQFFCNEQHRRLWAQSR